MGRYSAFLMGLGYGHLLLFAYAICFVWTGGYNFILEHTQRDIMIVAWGMLGALLISFAQTIEHSEDARYIRKLENENEEMKETLDHENLKYAK